MEWSVVSKAAERSRSVRSDVLPARISCEKEIVCDVDGSCFSAVVENHRNSSRKSCDFFRHVYNRNHNAKDVIWKERS